MTSTDETVFDPQIADSLAARVGTVRVGRSTGRGRRIALACARFNGGITTRLLESALNALDEAGVERRDVTIGWVPGAFELPLLALEFADGERPHDTVIALGAVIRGETGHYELVAGECARGIQDVQLSTRVPVIFGVLTTETVDQALERSMPDDSNKGREAVVTALEMVDLLRTGASGT
ncbi:MAG TPA: 6,7-dimethyl-8-ribityllumazine synthase [Acidimicrobiales bacterium]|nr:6,7-dimethyl-8-ribityllumazine synthase [Acidimicrobiales bacterium]